MKSQELRNKANKLYSEIVTVHGEILAALFDDIQNLQSFELVLENEYDDNNYYDQIYLQSVNGVDLPHNLCYTDDLKGDEIEESFTKFAVASKIKISELIHIVQIVIDIPDTYYSNNCKSLFFERPKPTTPNPKKES